MSIELFISKVGNEESCVSMTDPGSPVASQAPSTEKRKEMSS